MSLTDKLKGKTEDIVGHVLGSSVVLSAISEFSNGDYKRGIAYGTLGILTHVATYRSSKTSRLIDELQNNIRKYTESLSFK